jgi:hypothetical protein
MMDMNMAAATQLRLSSCATVSVKCQVVHKPSALKGHGFIVPQILPDQRGLQPLRENWISG